MSGRTGVTEDLSVGDRGDCLIGWIGGRHRAADRGEYTGKCVRRRGRQLQDTVVVGVVIVVGVVDDAVDVVGVEQLVLAGRIRPFDAEIAGPIHLVLVVAAAVAVTIARIEDYVVHDVEVGGRDRGIFVPIAGGGIARAIVGIQIVMQRSLAAMNDPAIAVVALGVV